MMREVTDASFGTEVLEATGPVVVDFWAPWCVPCKAAGETLRRLAQATDVAVVTVNVDENPLTASRYGVLSLPTAILFEGGKARNTVLGARPRRHYERAWARWLADG